MDSLTGSDGVLTWPEAFLASVITVTGAVVLILFLYFLFRD